MTTWLPPAHLALSLVILIWNVVLAGRIAQNRGAPRVLATLSGLTALLLLPAAVVHIASATYLTGRGIAATGWIWPAMTCLVTAQVAYALARKLVSPFWGIPILVYDLILVVAALVRYAVAHGHAPVTPLLTVMSAQSTMMSIVTLSSITMITPFYINVPLIAPAFPALRRTTFAFRLAISLYAMMWSALFFAIALVRTVDVQQRFADTGNAQVHERPRGDFRVGLKILPDVSSLPSEAASRQDIALADTIGVDAYTVVVVPGAGRLAVDSIGRIVDRLRTDSTVIVVAVGYRHILIPELGRSPFDPQLRLATVERIAARLRPDILLPAEDPYGAGARAHGALPVEEWHRYLTQAALTAKRANPATRIGVSIAHYGPADSALYAWAAAAGSPIDILGFTMFPSRLGLQDIRAFQNAADRWMKTTPSLKDHWVFAAGGFPLAHGERAQERAIAETIEWATGRANLKGITIYEAGDYGEVRGLRAPNGRIRAAARAVATAIRILRESITL
jgi:hypothetical protein